MCVSNDAIEQRAYEISKEIRMNTIYHFVRAEGVNGQMVELHNHTKLALIKSVILADSEGVLYAVEANSTGLRFAKGKISYQEYNLIQRKEMFQGMGVFSAVVGSFLLMGWGIVTYIL